jgi:hypothetical protein
MFHSRIILLAAMVAQTVRSTLKFRDIITQSGADSIFLSSRSISGIHLKDPKSSFSVACGEHFRSPLGQPWSSWKKVQWMVDG